MINTCDNWVLIRIHNDDDKTAGWKVVAGTSGGYAYGNSWRVNSGIKDYTDEGDHYLFNGYSGSTYKCMKEAEMIRMNIADVVKQMEDTGLATVQCFEDFKKEWQV